MVCPLLRTGLALSLCLACGAADADTTTQLPPPVTERKGAVEPGEVSAPESQPAEAEPPAGAAEALLRLIRTEQIPGPKSEAWPGLGSMGITLNLSATNIYQHNAHGGLDTHHGHRFSGSFDIELTLDTGAMGLWDGGQFYVFSESMWNETISDRAGDLFGVNGDSFHEEAIRVRELWYQHLFLDDKLRIKLGKYDIAVDIDTNAYANWEVTQFLNNALINTGNIPFPDFGIGAVVSVIPTDWLYVTAAATDAQANGDETGLNTGLHDEDYFLSALELGLTPVWETSVGKLPGAYRFLLWYDPQPKEAFFDDRGGRRRRGPIKRDDAGFAFNMDQLLFKEQPGNENDLQGLGVFMRYGYAHEEVSQIEHFWSLGGQYQGLIPTRDDDVLGFGFAQGIISDRLHTIEEFGSRESVYELYYNTAVTPWLHITPDFQYIMDTGGDPSGRDAFVVGVRVVVAF